MANGNNDSEKKKRLFRLAKRYGFTKREADWLVKNNFDPDDEAVKKLFKRRNTEVKLVMGFIKASRAVAVRQVAKARLAEAKRLGISDPWDLFVTGS